MKMKNKNISKYLIVSLVSLLLFSACDKVEPPYMHDKNTSNNDTAAYYRVVLLEDFTGHKCINCPAAAAIAKDIEGLLAEKVVIIAVHAGYFATPDPGGLYTNDFRTTEGTEIDDYFAVGAAGNPNGLVNRRLFDGNRIVGPTDWAGRISEISAEPPSAFLTIEHTYNSQSKQLDVSVTSLCLENMDGDFYLSVFITEDSIIAPQRNNNEAYGPKPDIVNFVHQHVLRASLNGTWGDLVFSGNIEAGNSIGKTYQYILPQAFVAKNCYLVAFLHNNETKEVIQAAKKKIM